jgi:tetratricopeptide (TPR) repeat protein
MHNPVSRNLRSTLGIRALVIGPILAILIPAALAQAPKPKEAEPGPKPPGLIVLQGDDAKRAAELDKAIEAALKADHWDEAIAQAEELLALRTRIQGPKHDETVYVEWRLKALRRVARMPREDRVAYQSAYTLAEQARTLTDQGKHAQAQPLFEKSLEIQRRLLTDDHTHTATSYNNLAVNLGFQGKHAQAQPLLEKALEINRRLFSDDHRNTAHSYNSLALNLGAQGRHAQAQPLLEKALEIYRRLFSDDHRNTTNSYNSLAANLNAQGKYTQAQPLLEKALEINRRLLTENHSDTATSYNELAINLRAQRKYALAQPLVEKVLEIRRRLLTENHPDIATSYNNVATNLSDQGKYAQAQTLYEKALEIRRRLLTDDHLDTALSYNHLAISLNTQGKYAQAQPLYEKALEIRRRLLTENHPDTARSYSNLGNNLSAQGKYAQAQPLYEKALEINRRLHTDDHPDTAQSYNNVGNNLGAQGKFAQAQPLYEKALEIRRQLHTDDHLDTAVSYSNMALNLDDQGKFAQAQPLYEKALEINRRLFSDDHQNTAHSYNSLAANLNDQGKFALAQPLLEKALEINRRRLTENHLGTANSYNNLAYNLNSQGNHALAQPLYEKALEICRRLLSDDHPLTATRYNNLAINLGAQGKYGQAQTLFEKELEIRRRLLPDDQPYSALANNYVATNLNAQGKYLEARDRWLSAVKSLDKVRLRVAFTGLERTGRTKESVHPSLAAVLARLGQPIEAWQALEEDLGRGLLDELTARQVDWLAPAEQSRLRELTNAVESLDRLLETTPEDLNLAERAKQFEELRRQRALAGIALGELQTKLARDHGDLEGHVASLGEIQAALPADAALVAWVDILPIGPNAADPDGEHWGMVLRSRGVPAWVPIVGTGPDRLWSRDDVELANQVRTELRKRPDGDPADLLPLIGRLRTQRLEALAKALGATADGLPTARRLIILPSRAMAGLPVEALLAQDDTRTVSYAPSATVFKYLRERPRPDRHAGLLALGDPVYKRPEKVSDPKPPDHGLLVNAVAPRSNAATRGLKPGDVLLSYNGTALLKREDLKAVPEPGRPVPVGFWRNGKVDRLELAPGKLGVMLDPKPAPLAIVDERNLRQVLAAARSGSETFDPLPGTRHEVEAIARLFQADARPAHVLLGSDASEPELDRLATLGKLGQFGVIHLATHGVIDEDIPARSAVILTQVGLPDPLDQILKNKPAFDGRLTVHEIQRGWELKAELVTLSACKTARGRNAGGEGFVGFTQALLISGARSVCLSLWEVDDRATSLLMTRFYQNWLGQRKGLDKPMPKAEALREAKEWLRGLSDAEGRRALAARGDIRERVGASKTVSLYAHPHYWAGFILTGDPD